MSPRSDDDDPNAGITLGLSSLSRTRSELALRRARKKKEDAQKAAPTKVPGVHQDALPSYAAGTAGRHVQRLRCMGRGRDWLLRAVNTGWKVEGRCG